MIYTKGQHVVAYAVQTSDGISFLAKAGSVVTASAHVDANPNLANSVAQTKEITFEPVGTFSILASSYYNDDPLSLSVTMDGAIVLFPAS